MGGFEVQLQVSSFIILYSCSVLLHSWHIGYSYHRVHLKNSKLFYIIHDDYYSDINDRAVIVKELNTFFGLDVYVTG